MAAIDNVDFLLATAAELQEKLSSGDLTSEELVQGYLKQIDTYNGRLSAVIQTAPTASVLAIAKALDAERKTSNTRGPLHGIPVILKDNIATKPELGLCTSGGSYAFSDLRAQGNAKMAQRLEDAGCIFIGKANLSEFANFKGNFMPCGWSARGGQTQSPYVKGGRDPQERFGGHSGPGGSSSGSAAAVAAGFAPVSVGTETWGSLIMPATRANLFTIKASRGVLSAEGIMPVNAILDVPGPMAKSAIDVANMLTAMASDGKGGIDYAQYATGNWDGLRLGAVKTANWKLDEILAEPDEDWFSQQDRDINAAYQTLADHQVSIKHPVELPPQGPLRKLLAEVINHNFKQDFESFLSQMASTPVRTVDELIQFNRDHADLELPPESPNQETLEAAAKAEQWSEERTQAEFKRGLEYAGTDGIDKCLTENRIDVILGPADSWLTDFACVAGYPSAMLPLSFWKKNGRPFGLIALAANRREDILIQVMSAWEKTFNVKVPPKL